MQAFEEARRQRIWLGYVAYVLEEIVCNYVFHGQYDISIGDIIRREDLTSEQTGHWFDFERFLIAKGFDSMAIRGRWRGAKRRAVGSSALSALPECYRSWPLAIPPAIPATTSNSS